MAIISTIATFLLGGSVGMLISLFQDVDEIIKGFLTFAKHVMGWVNKMLSKYEDFLSNKSGSPILVEVPINEEIEKTLAPVITKEQLDNAKVIHIGALADNEGNIHKIDTVMVPTEGTDDELRVRFNEGGGVIRFSV